MSIKRTLQIAKELGITLKNIKTFPGHDGIPGFDADICINGKKVLHVHDGAYGGSYEYRPVDGNYKEAYKLQETLNEKIKSYGKHECKLGGRVFMMCDDLDSVCAAIVSEVEFEKQLKKDTKKGILLKNKDEESYRIAKFKQGNIPNLIKKFPKEQVLKTLQKSVDIFIKQNEVILNKEYLESVGVEF